MAQDVFSEMAVEPFMLNEDGYLNVNRNIKEIIYHPSLNVILISSETGIVHVLDVNSGVILLSSCLSASDKTSITCKYVPGQDRILFCDGENLGVRSDYNGVLLLDSILQKTITNSKEYVKLELPLSEAIILKQSLTLANISGIEHILNELTDVIANAQKQSKKGIKAQKWNTVCLQLPLDAFQLATANAVAELLAKNQHTPELGVASAVHERLSELMDEQVNLNDKKYMASESRRRETFSQWPHMDYKWALPDQMAQAGFYHQPNTSGDDRAMCFTCTVCLVCWERTDEPFSEHERHSPNCPFVMGEYTQNVPLSVTYATNAAADATYRGNKVTVVGNSNVSEMLPTANSDGLISVFDISGKIKRTHLFFVTHFDSHILERITKDFGTLGLWTQGDERKCPVDKNITALTIVGDKRKEHSENIRPSVICGLKITSIVDDTSMQDPDVQETSNVKLYLVVYDFTYTKELDEPEIEKKTDSKTNVAYSAAAFESLFDQEITNITNSMQILPETESFSSWKQLLSYKTLIPGEMSGIYIPPKSSKSHSGPRVLPVDLMNSETDGGQSLTFPVSPLHMSDSNAVETPDVSISDHIKELKNNKTLNKLNYSYGVQCIYVNCNSPDMEITHVIPTPDNSHILVVIGSKSSAKSVLMLYELVFTHKMVKLNDRPVRMRTLELNEQPVEVNILPVMDKLKSNAKYGIEGHITVVCVDGAVRIIELCTMSTVCEAKLEGEKYLSATYCNSLERLCISTKKGSLHFYALNDNDNESLEDHDEEDFSNSNMDSTPGTAQSQDSENLIEMRCFNEPVDVIPLNELQRLNELCEFEPLKTGYCAIVPPCWSDIQQALRQRRAPFKLNTESSDQYTKTWRLQTDTTTWDEHIFEVSFPTATSLGHVDVHFILQPSTAVPHVEVTLLRQNSNGIGHKRDVRFGVDESITIDMLQWADNPVISQEYLRAHNAEILAGPINIAKHLDLLEQSATVTLTSPKLFRSKCRTLLIHIRAVYTKDDVKQKPAQKSSFDSIMSSLDINKIGSSSSSRKTDFYMGCDCIHELSLTVFTSKNTHASNEKTQRSYMLESNVFVQSLFLTAISPCTNETLGYVLDILNWVASIRLSRNRSNNGDAPNHQLDFISVILNNMSGIMNKCLLLGRRSIAHKCMKLLITCCSGAKNIHESIGENFNTCVLNTLLPLFDSIDTVRSAGGLQWILAITLKVTNKDKENILANKLLETLCKITEELNKRTNPYHLLLRSRYGLYGTPMEPELFDVDIPSHVKCSSPSSYSVSSAMTDSSASGTDFFSNFSYNKESISAKDVLFNSDPKLKYKNIASPKIIKGLIETVPLHFVCVGSSEGTRLERADASSTQLSTVFPITITATDNNVMLKKEDVQHILNNMTNVDNPDWAPYATVNLKPLQTCFGYNYPSLKDLLPEFIPDPIFPDNIYENISAKIAQTNAVESSSPEPTMSQFNTTGPSSMTWQHLLVPPPQLVIVVERMHSGARRYVVFDFGQPVLLTDVIIPSCSDLVSISVDIWLQGNDIDETRLVTASDISTRNLVLNDLQGPPLCRFVKITAIGRYGMSTARCRIPVGYFYGHIIVLPEEVPRHLKDNPEFQKKEGDVEKQLNILSNLLEDINCRYSLACSKLKDLLQPYIVSDIKNAENLFTYINIMKDFSLNLSNVQHGKIFSSYQDAINYQVQLNTVKNVMWRIEESLNKPSQQKTEGLTGCSTDKLRSIAEGVVELLLSIDATPFINLKISQQLFNGLCVCQMSRLQLLAAVFLDKSCGRKSFWGNFLADTLFTMFSTSFSIKFPQDRLFILLNFLSRRTPERSAVIDAALRVLSQTLKPVLEPNRTLLAISIDLPQMSWLLMYLSMQLDLVTNAKSGCKWSFVFGELIEKTNVDNSKISNRKKACKRVCGHSIIGGHNTGTQLSSQTYASKLGSHWKANEILMSDKLKNFKFFKVVPHSDCNKNNKDNPESKVDKPTLKLPQHIDKVHCQLVAKGLIHFILSMDHSSSADMMLLSFKIVARLVTIARLKLGQLMNEEQLLRLINLCISSNIAWSMVALTCFLEDALDFISCRFQLPDLDTITPASSSWSSSDMISDVEGLCETFNIEETLLVEPATKNKSNVVNNNAFPPLPSVYESDGSDVEEVIDDLSKLTRPTVKKPAKTTYKTNLNISTAIDSRLELGVTSSADINIKKMLIKNTEILFHNVTASNATTDSEGKLTPWPTHVEPLPTETNLSNDKMLTNCFERLFDNLQLQSPVYIEEVINFWLTLNSSNNSDRFDPAAVPKIPLNAESVKHLVSALAWTSGLSLTTWCISLQTLTLVCNTITETNSHWTEVARMAAIIVNHPDFSQFMLRLLSGNGIVFTGKVLAGPTLCKALHGFLVRLQMRCDIVSQTSVLGNTLKTLLLKVVYQLIQPMGSIIARQGPLDAQCKLLQSMLYVDYTNTDLSIAMSIFESTGVFVQSYVENVDKVKCVNIGEKQNATSNTFSEIFASVLGSESNKTDRPVSCDILIIYLLRLLGKLVETPIAPNPNTSEPMDTPNTPSSQTDESKAEQIQQDTLRAEAIPCFADVVLRHHPCVIRLCNALASCRNSSLCMLVNLTQKSPYSSLSEPTTIGDAVFHVLALLAKKASERELLMQPLLMFLNQTSSLSEPLLWFILQVVDNEEAIQCFLDGGGITILAKSIVESSNAPSTIARMGMISTVMQHFSGNNGSSSDAGNIISSAASTTKKMLQANYENKLSLINFAPNCTIKCLSGTAQPAEVLIQGVTATSHRRARTPLWSYHYYPEEVHTELMLQLPSAILLREVQLQPHTIGLATCPSAVALEISSTGPSRLVPACTPIPTSGMTYIRLHLQTPKVVNCVLIRLYKPRDANSIGLLQIRLLGNTAYGQSFSDISDDESHCRHSLGWLRLLHHCFSLPTDRDLLKQVVGCASQVSNLLSCCCGLLLVPSHILPVYMQCLERVLRELALYSPENGILAIKVLLNNKPNVIEPMQVQNNWQERQLVSATSDFSSCELLYQICEHQDSNTFYRISMVLEWLQKITIDALTYNNIENCNSIYMSCIASILWSANESNINYDIKVLITHDLFNSIFNLKVLAKNSSNLKYSLDSLLCSICYINPDFYPLLLQKLGILIPNLATDHEASISDDRKDLESMTDDNKYDYQANTEWYNHLMIGELSNLSYEQLETIALVSRSSTAMKQLLDSGFPKLLNQAILKFCSSNDDSVDNVEKVIAILKFFTDVSDEKVMRDWLGSTDGSSFWLHLLHKLCKKPAENKSNLPSEAHVQLEEICVKFLSKCCLCHTANQTRLAKVLCEVIALQKNGMSGFLRRIILQLLLEYEKIPVSVCAEENLYKTVKVSQSWLPSHPGIKQSHNKVMLYLSTNTTLYDILEQHIYFNKTCKRQSTSKKLSNNREMYKGWFTEEGDLSMAAGVTAKDKRAKDVKNQITATPQSKKKRYTNTEASDETESIGGRLIKCDALSDQPLSLSLNLSQLLRLIEAKGNVTDWPCIHLSIYLNKGSEEKNSNGECSTSSTNCYQSFGSALQIFSSMGGLALLAQHLPTVYPETVRIPTEKTSADTSDSDWIKLEDCDEIYEDILEDAVGTSSPSKGSGTVSHIPSHSLTAFGLFLRLPGYAELLLKDTKRGLCLLRLVLGVSDDGEGGDIFQSPVADSLPTLPFEILRQLYNATPLSTDDGMLLRRISINSGVVHLLLACINVFTHHSQNNDKDGNKKGKDDRSQQLYWAKGTGFGTGSTQQSWNVEQALMKQRSEEEHVTVLLQVLASYINPSDKASDELSKDVLPPSFVEHLDNSTLLPALSAYLKNDSVFDMARHIPLYKAILQLLRAIASSSQLVGVLLLRKSRSGEPSLCSLLKNMKTCVDTYTSKLKLNSGNSKFKTKLGEQLEDLEQGEGLATLMPDIEETTALVARYTNSIVNSDTESDREDCSDSVSTISPEERYIKTMKNLQFGSYEMIKEFPDGGCRFVVSHHFESNAKSTGEQSHPVRVKRIAQEAVTLSTSLPLSYSSSVFVRYDTSRLDVMKVLIIGPSDTPYANGCFELDVFFPSDYPLSPMMINLETTGHHTVRFNPNLYNDGKVCLSVLNTWHGKPEEKWNPQTSSFLQVLVSIQSLILVPEPYFNEPGYERARGTPAGTASSKDYNLTICQATVRWAMLEQILNPCPCFKDIIHTHFFMKKDEIIKQVEGWVKELEEDVSKEKKSNRATKKTPASSLEVFKSHFNQLKEQLIKLQLPGEMAEAEVSQKLEDADEDMEKLANDMCEY